MELSVSQWEGTLLIYIVIGSIFNTNLAKNILKRSLSRKCHAFLMIEHEMLLTLLMTFGLHHWTLGNECYSSLISEVFQ